MDARLGEGEGMRGLFLFCLIGTGAWCAARLRQHYAERRASRLLLLDAHSAPRMSPSRKTARRRYSVKQVREIEFFLPVVMEKMVMAALSGLDIIPAMKRVTEVTPRKVDPVTRLFAESLVLIESGSPVEDSLRCVIKDIPSPALRHAFMHLGFAYKEGGELVLPLRELSDATQLHYQERAEEEMARLPVKATMPLLLTFAGLILIFITSPLLQVAGILSKSVPN